MFNKKIIASACIALTTVAIHISSANAKVMLSPSWSGFYIAGGIGVQQLDADIDVSSFSTSKSSIYDYCRGCLPGKSASYNFSGEDSASGDWNFFGTAMIGYDHQASERVVVGAFASYDFGSTDLNYNLQLGSGRSSALASGTLEADNVFTIGGRVGYVFDDEKMTMGYLLAGYTRTSVEGRLNMDFTGVPASDFSQEFSGNLNGFTLGGGVERRLNERWSARLEYRYTWLGDVDSLYNESSRTRVGPNCYSTSSSETDANFDPSIHSVRAVLSYKFGDHLAPLPEPKR